MELVRQRGIATTIKFPLIDYGGTDFEDTPVVFVLGDAQISKDDGAFINTINSPVHKGNGIYKLQLTATEMQATSIEVTIKDQDGPLWEDQAILVSSGQPLVNQLMADTGFTAGGTMTYADYLKIQAAWAAGKWQLKTGTTDTYQLLDVDDATTVIMEFTLSQTTPFKTVSVI